MKKTLAIILSVCMLFSSVFCVTLTANAGELKTHGKLDGFYWDFDIESSTLTVSGKGKIPQFFMSDGDGYGGYFPEPAYSLTKKLVIADGITEVGFDSFGLVGPLEEMEFADSVETICGESDAGLTGLNSYKLKKVKLGKNTKEIYNAFGDSKYLKQITLPDSLEKFTIWQTSLKSITLPKNMKYFEVVISNELEEINILPGAPVSTKLSIFNCPNLKKINIYGDKVGSFTNNNPLDCDNSFNAVFRCIKDSEVYKYYKKNTRFKVEAMPESEVNPPAVSNFKVTGSNNSAVYLSWSKQKSAIGYRIYKYNPKTKKYESYNYVDKNTNTLKVSGLKNNTSYKFKIRAYHKLGDRNLPCRFSKEIIGKTKRNMVTLGSVKSNSKKRITAKWNKALYDCSGYQVMWSTTSDFSRNYKTMDVTGRSKVSATIKTAQSKKNYYVKVRPYKITKGKRVYHSWSKAVKIYVK